MNMKIIWHGKACRGVDVAPNAPEPVKYAAGELVRFITSKTGCALPFGKINDSSIILRLAADGPKYQAALGSNPTPESYVVDADEHHIYLIGTDPAGLVYAVFDFLGTEVGIGFGGLGDVGVRIRFHPCLEVKVRRRHAAPQLTVRGLQGAIREDAVEAENGISPLHRLRLDWMAQNRMNYYLVDPGYQRTGFNNIRKLLPEVKRRGLKVQWGHHIWKRLVPAEKYFDRHPEYYRMQNGKRTLPDSNSQLCFCTSNPEVAKVMADEIIAILDEFPDIDVMSLWPEDGGGMCECPECAKITSLPKDWSYDRVPGTDIAIPVSRHDRHKTVRYARFINEVARRVGKVHPKVMLSACFYYDTDAPPEGVTLEPNIQPVVAHYWRCWRHPLNHPHCENSYYNRITREWAQLYPGRVVIYEYFMGMSVHSSLPWSIVPTMHHDWKSYREMGIAGTTIQSQASHFTVYGGNYSAFARLAWNLDQSTEDAAWPYYYDLYEESAPPLIKMAKEFEERFTSEDHEPANAQYIDFKQYAEEAVYRDYFKHCVYPFPDTIARVFDDSVMRCMDEHLREARTLAQQERVKVNVAKLQAAVDYWKMAYEFFKTLGTARELSATESPQAVPTYEKCLALCDQIMGYLEIIPYVDVVAREMALRNYWPKIRGGILMRIEKPFEKLEYSHGRWP